MSEQRSISQDTHDLEITVPRVDAIHSKPTTVLHKLDSTNGVYVQCRLLDGKDVYVPLMVICELFKKEVFEEIKNKGFRA